MILAEETFAFVVPFFWNALPSSLPLEVLLTLSEPGALGNAESIPLPQGRNTPIPSCHPQPACGLQRNGVLMEDRLVAALRGGKSKNQLKPPRLPETNPFIPCSAF